MPPTKKRKVAVVEGIPAKVQDITPARAKEIVEECIKHHEGEFTYKSGEKKGKKKENKSATMIIDQLQRGLDGDERSCVAWAKLIRDMDKKTFSAGKRKDGRIQLRNFKAVEGSLLEKVLANYGKRGEVKVPHLLWFYKQGKWVKLSAKRGGLTIDHIDEDVLNNCPYTNLRLVAHELNSFRKSAKKDNFQNRQFNLSLHPTIIDKKTKKFRAPFTRELMMSHPAGKKLTEEYGYHEGASFMSLKRWSGKNDVEKRRKRYFKIKKLVCKFLIHLIENHPTFCEDMSVLDECHGWTNAEAKINNLEILRMHV